MESQLPDFLLVVVSKQDVLAANTEPTLQVLSQLLVSAETVRRYRERVDIAFHGYETDHRELFEIPEVRSFVANARCQLSLLDVLPIQGPHSPTSSRILFSSSVSDRARAA